VIIAVDHQQQLLRALRRQALRWNTVTKLPSIIKTASENVTTDLGIWRAIPLPRALVVHGKDGKMTRFELQSDPTYLPEGSQVLVPKKKVNEAILKRFRE
jgi:polyisoprenyl-teichoic acid--peptidoglycan teichoic acid transferase